MPSPNTRNGRFDPLSPPVVTITRPTGETWVVKFQTHNYTIKPMIPSAKLKDTKTRMVAYDAWLNAQRVPKHRLTMPQKSILKKPSSVCPQQTVSHPSSGLFKLPQVDKIAYPFYLPDASPRGRPIKDVRFTTKPTFEKRHRIILGKPSPTPKSACPSTTTSTINTKTNIPPIRLGSACVHGAAIEIFHRSLRHLGTAPDDLVYAPKAGTTDNTAVVRYILRRWFDGGDEYERFGGPVGEEVRVGRHLGRRKCARMQKLMRWLVFGPRKEGNQARMAAIAEELGGHVSFEEVEPPVEEEDQTWWRTADTPEDRDSGVAMENVGEADTPGLHVTWAC